MVTLPDIWDLHLIDGDRIIHAAGHSSQKVVKGEVVHIDDVSFALQKVKLAVAGLKDIIKAKTRRIFIGNPDVKHFRYAIAKIQPYKEHRGKQARPAYEKEIREYLIKYHKAEVVTGIETDDALGIEQMKCVKAGGTSIISSSDKDLNMIPGGHHDMDWGKIRTFKENEYVMKSYLKTNIAWIDDPGFLSLRTYGVNKKKKLIGGGQLWFAAQLLTGDKTDNIPGCIVHTKTGKELTIGDVTAYDILKDVKTFEQAIKTVWVQYQVSFAKKLTPEETFNRFIEVAKLVWIKRETTMREKIFPLDWVKVE